MRSRRAVIGGYDRFYDEVHRSIHVLFAHLLDQGGLLCGGVLDLAYFLMGSGDYLGMDIFSDFL